MKWRRVDGTKKGAPAGVDRDVSDIEGVKRVSNIRGKSQKKQHMIWGCRS